MLLIKIYILSILLINKALSSGHNHLTEQLALITLAAGRPDGNGGGKIVRDVNGNFLEIQIDEENNIYADITEIIPDLNGCKASGDCDERFSKIYKDSVSCAISKQLDLNDYNYFIPLFDNNLITTGDTNFVRDNNEIMNKLENFDFKIYPSFSHTFNNNNYYNRVDINNVINKLVILGKNIHNQNNQNNQNNQINNINDFFNRLNCDLINPGTYNDLVNPNSHNPYINKLNADERNFINKFFNENNRPTNANGISLYDGNENTQIQRELIFNLFKDCLTSGCREIPTGTNNYEFIKVNNVDNGNDKSTYHMFCKTQKPTGTATGNPTYRSVNNHPDAGIREVVRLDKDFNLKTLPPERIVNSYKNIHEKNNGYKKTNGNVNINNHNIYTREQSGIDLIGKWGVTLIDRNNNHLKPDNSNNGYRIKDNSNQYISDKVKNNIIGTTIKAVDETTGDNYRSIPCDYINKDMSSNNRNNIPRGVVSKYSSQTPNFISLESMCDKFMENRELMSGVLPELLMSDAELDNFRNLATARHAEEIFAVGINGYVDGVINKVHKNEFDKSQKAIKHIVSTHKYYYESQGDIETVAKCDAGSLKKRAGGSCTLKSPTLENNVNIDSTLNEIKNIIKLDIDKSINDNSKSDNYSRLNSIMNILNENKDKINDNNKLEIVNKLSDLLTMYKENLNTKEIIDSNSSKDTILSKDLEHLTNRLKSFYHNDINQENINNQEKYDDNNDENNDPNNNNLNENEERGGVDNTPSIFLDVTNTNANSIGNEEKLLTSLNNLELVTKQNTDNIDNNNSRNSVVGIGINKNLNIDCDIKTLVNNIDNFDINNEEGLQALVKEYHNINSIDENNNTDELKDKKTYHKKIVRKVKLALAKKLQEAINAGKLNDINTGNIKDISLNDNTSIEEINQNDIDNFKANSISAIYTNDQVTFISTINYSTAYIKYFVNNMKKEIANISKNNLPKDKYNLIKAFHSLITSQGNKLISYESPNNKDAEILHFTELLHNYDDLYAFAVTVNKYSLNGSPGVTIENYIVSDELKNKLNYHVNRLIQDNVNDFIRYHNENHPKNNLFIPSKYIDDSSVISESQKCKWGFKSAIIIDLKVLASVMIFPKDSVPETFKEFINQSGSNDKFSDVSRAYHVKNNIHKYESPITTDSNQSNELVEMNNLLSFSSDKNNIESYNEINYRGLTEYLTVMANYDPNINLAGAKNDANGNLIPSSIYKGASSVSDIYSKINVQVNRLNNNKKLTKQDKTKINNAVENLANNTVDAKFKLVKALGKEHPDTMDSAISDFNNNVKNVRTVSSNGVTKSNSNLDSVRNTSNSKFSTSSISSISKKLKEKTNKLLKRKSTLSKINGKIHKKLL
ncbi:hypothetical protein BCR32DRAFT_249386 [Anaeromyces robustus]|uniref:Uncharacterized protein n=1 Tax=Anaeromyces robustus TaxID=1754192 RepID=A0A1Y1WRA2_9FUNG|nr:hypothetical protein BCR32DRAFT_249386 [Anaeromyces robustus]|eukprot:ORX75654.1 hypothetical protein BCR32DRAFT_249386 [Anaeromyces robustus]